MRASDGEQTKARVSTRCPLLLPQPPAPSSVPGPHQRLHHRLVPAVARGGAHRSVVQVPGLVHH